MATENDPEKCEVYCYRQLLKYKPFRAVEELTADFDGNAASAWVASYPVAWQIEFVW